MEIVSYPKRVHVCLSDVEFKLLFVLLCKYQELAKDKRPDIYSQFTDTFLLALRKYACTKNTLEFTDTLISNIETMWGKKYD